VRRHWGWRFRRRNCTPGFGAGIMGRKCLGPMAEKTAPQAQEAWKKGSLGALQAEGLRRGEEVGFADEIKKLCL
jgi:hypothetical protein